MKDRSFYGIATERLQLSIVDMLDADDLFKSMSNPSISADMSWKPHATVQDTEQFILAVTDAFENEKSVTWVIRLRSDGGKAIGIFSIISILRKHRELVYDRAELAYWIDPAFQGRGFMTEAGAAILEFGFRKMQLHKIFVSHHLNNSNSMNLIKRLKFQPIYIEKQSFKKNGEWIDVAHYEMLESDYLKLYK